MFGGVCIQECWADDKPIFEICCLGASRFFLELLAQTSSSSTSSLLSAPVIM
jgi:hypothetical protein